MIRGARYWNDRTRYCVQTNNPTEEQLRKHGTGSWLETCGPTAAVNCLGALGVNLAIVTPGGYVPQPEEVLADWFNDPANYQILRAARPDVDPAATPSNRVPQDYPPAVRAVFGAQGEYSESATWAHVAGWLKEGAAVQICLASPGHYLAAVAYGELTDELLYHDSWPARVGGDGFCKRMKSDEYLRSVKNFCIVYRAA